MISGRQALTQILDAQRTQHGEVTGLDGKIDELGRQLLAVQQRRADDLTALARVRVDLVDNGTLTAPLRAAERQVAALLTRRNEEAEALKQDIAAARAARTALDQEREAVADRLEAADRRVDEAEAATQARLDAEPAYQAQRERAREAERMAMHADEKAAASEQELEAKGTSYRADRLFMYLWERRFGTPEYRPRGLIRWLDGRVAGLIGYEAARLNYRRLLDIPARLREHANAVSAAADAEHARLRGLDDEARAADGIPALEQARAAEQASLAAVDQRIAEAEDAIAGMLAREARVAAGDDDHSRQAVDYLASELGREDLATLRRDALATPFPDDDQIVTRLLDAEQEQRRLSFMLENLKQTRAKQQDKLTELARLEREFKRRRMDQGGSGFADGAMIAMMIANFVNGALDRDALMRVLEEQQRREYRDADPTFGSGGFGRGTPWGGGIFGGDSGGVLGGRSRGSGGGIFRGGRGGGGGGGFRTGGGF